MQVRADERAGERPRGRANRRRSGGDAKKRDDLLDIAIGVIAERGLQACTFRTLAREAGASTMTYTYEFGNRAGLLEAILERCGRQLWTERNLDGDHPDPLAHLRRAAMGGCQLEAELNPYLRTYDLLLIDAPHDEDLADLVGSSDMMFLTRYVEIIRACQKQGQIPAEIDPEDLVFQIWSLGDGLNLQRYAHPDLFDQERMTRLFTEGFDALVSGHPA